MLFDFRKFFNTSTLVKETTLFLFVDFNRLSRVKPLRGCEKKLLGISGIESRSPWNQGFMEFCFIILFAIWHLFEKILQLLGREVFNPTEVKGGSRIKDSFPACIPR